MQFAVTIDLAYTTDDYGGNRYLTLIEIGLKNQGKVRLDARRCPYEHPKEGPEHNYKHGCSLKIREVPNIPGEGVHLDWFSDLPSRGWGKPIELNALSGYVKGVRRAWGRTAKNQTDFWMEPGESYTLAVPVFLKAGNYFARSGGWSSVSRRSNRSARAIWQYCQESRTSRSSGKRYTAV